MQMLSYRLVLPGVLMLVLVGTAYTDQPPAAHTGGFGEPTCLQCHFDETLNTPGGQLALGGVPAPYTPGTEYRLVVRLARPELQRGGFQLSARYAAGAHAGEQAGSLAAPDEGVAVDLADAIQYARHTRTGSEAAAGDSIEWIVSWTAPDVAADTVVFHVAANASNGDDSQFGDFVYTLEAAAPAAPQP